MHDRRREKKAMILVPPSRPFKLRFHFVFFFSILKTSIVFIRWFFGVAMSRLPFEDENYGA